MFNHYTSTQPLADQIKALIGPRREATRRIYTMITRFERAAWYPAAFAEAAAATGFTYAERLTFTGDNITSAATRLLEGYLSAVGEPVDADERLTVRQAADLLGLSVSAVKAAAQRGDLPAEHVDAPGNGFYRIRRADAEAWGATFTAGRDHRPGRKPKTITPG